MNCVVKASGSFLPLVGLLSLTFLGTGCSTLSYTPADAGRWESTPLDPVSVTNSVSANPPGSSDLLRPGDGVIINFSGVQDPPSRVEDRINEKGEITLPYFGRVQAAGKTRVELQETILALFVPKLYKRLTISVNPDVRFYYMSGEVKKEGNYTYVGGMTVMKAIAAAGGFTDFAKKTRVEITRANGKVNKVNCNKAQKDAKLDPPIYPDDRIFVPRRLW